MSYFCSAMEFIYIPIKRTVIFTGTLTIYMYIFAPQCFLLTLTYFDCDNPSAAGWQLCSEWFLL